MLTQNVPRVLRFGAHAGRGVRRLALDATLGERRDIPRTVADLTPQRLSAITGLKVRGIAVLDGAAGRDDLGQMFGGDLSEREVRYLIAEEWAETADDVIWRRTKRGLRMNCDETVTLDLFMAGVTAAAELAEERAYSGA